MTDFATRLTQAERRQDWPNVRPRDAATLILIDHKGKKPRVLMGRRHPKLKFMPGVFVFPGGRVDADDWRVPVAEGYEPAVARRLATAVAGRFSAARARALGVAAVRESLEEAGVLVGRRAGVASLRRLWPSFAERALLPDLRPLRFFARAVTPPGQPRRFDARFFAVAAECIADRIPVEALGGELEEVQWVDLGALDRLPTAGITRRIAAELAQRLAADPALSADWPVPFFTWRGDERVRREI